jgi:TRAP-type mannitol/chloroaromatic compound transport system permease small subunit
VLVMYLSWPVFMLSYSGHEMSGDAGGLVRWPVKLLMPLGFALLVLQGLSQIVKRIAYLRGAAPLDEGSQEPV